MKLSKKSRLLFSVLLLFLVTDLGYSFFQHLSQPLDGDMAWNLIPAKDVKPILENPLGLEAIISDSTYANPNRFFCHWSFREYLLSTPIIIQTFVDPIDSVYLACAIAKILIQLMLIILLATAINGSLNLFTMDFIRAAVLVTPLFQTNGYRVYMGIIDPSTTYAFFYALPTIFIIIYFMPILLKILHNKELRVSWFFYFAWILIAFVVCLSGPLNPGIALIFSSLLVLYEFGTRYKRSGRKGNFSRVLSTIKLIPKGFWMLLFPVILLSLYSLFLGRYNSITISNQIPLSEMYVKIPEGIYHHISQKPGVPLLLAVLMINLVLIAQYFKDDNGRKIVKIFYWVGIFSLCYILLLPLGGYRGYRPFIIRYDTLIPITLSLFFLFGYSSLFLLKNINKKNKWWYSTLIAGVVFIFTIADEPNFSNNTCERNALIQIAKSPDNTVALDHDCSVLEWRKITEPRKTNLHGELLMLWNITEGKKYYYNK